jgi:hypothetical protein
MPAISTAIAVASLAVGIGGAAVAYSGMQQQKEAQQKQAEAQQQALDFQQQAESKREQAMKLDAERRQREIVRQGVAARSMALATATTQGAAANGSSALGGAYGQISGRTGVNALGINQQSEIGSSMFALNRGVLGAYRDAASAGSSAAAGAGLVSLGGMFMKNYDMIPKIGVTLGGLFSNSNPVNVGSATTYRA